MISLEDKAEIHNEGCLLRKYIFKHKRRGNWNWDYLVPVTQVQLNKEVSQLKQLTSRLDLLIVCVVHL